MTIKYTSKLYLIKSPSFSNLEIIYFEHKFFVVSPDVSK